VAHIATRRTKRGDVRYDVRVRIGGPVVNRTFTRRRDAGTVEGDRLRGLAIDPRAGLITFETSARQWVRQRPHRPLIRDLYEGILRNHLLPTFGDRPIGKVMPAEIRSWCTELGTKLAPATTTRVYRLLDTIFATAVEDELVMRNPCLVRGASTTTLPDRPTATIATIATIAEVDALVEAIDDQYRAMVILAAWCGLRHGELLAVTRRRINLDQGTVEVVASSY
jgi:integrase